MDELVSYFVLLLPFACMSAPSKQLSRPDNTLPPRQDTPRAALLLLLPSRRILKELLLNSLCFLFCARQAGVPPAGSPSDNSEFDG